MNGADEAQEEYAARWAVDLQNDFRARLDWCVKDYACESSANGAGDGGSLRRVHSGERVELNGEDRAMVGRN
jgi:hypothetical protein